MAIAQTARSKRYQELKKLVDVKKLYSPLEAMELVKQTSKTKFDSTIEVHLNLGIDVKKGDQQVRATILFPHSIGKSKKVVAFVAADREKDAKEAGADVVGGEDLINEIAKAGKIDCDITVATPDMMPKLAKVAKILGPAGLMPNPKTETVGPNIKKIIEEIKKGKVAFKNDATANIHQAIGKASMDVKALSENLTTFVEAVKKTKPASSKGVFFKSITVTSTMGPAVRVDASSFAS
jgi:large subunit ribosomal protein L1